MTVQVVYWPNDAQEDTTTFPENTWDAIDARLGILSFTDNQLTDQYEMTIIVLENGFPNPSVHNQPQPFESLEPSSSSGN